MSVILLLLSASLLIATGFLIAFIWSVKTGQFDDSHTPAIRMLFDDKKIEKSTKAKNDTTAK
jgi:cbb3-type cytochrome oxidase maturation protein